MAKSVKKMNVKEYLEWIKSRKSLTTLDKKLGVRANRRPHQDKREKDK